ncbi:hypothetical protein ES703_26310 [subsurface metagenome]
MHIHTDLKAGKEILFLIAGTQDEKEILERFAKHREPLTAHLEINDRDSYPCLVIRKEP